MRNFNMRSELYERSSYVDAGLRSYMLNVYNYMALALVITGFVSFLVGTNQVLSNIVFGTGLAWLFVFAPVIMAFVLSYKIASMSIQSARVMFFTFAGLMGISLGSVFLMYTGESIARTFFITASTFGAMSLYGYTTKKDISSWGSFLLMGLFGIILASIVNFFLHSPMLHFISSIVGVVVFTGLIAYDTNRIKDFYYSADEFNREKVAMYGALSLYMDFVNLFIHLLQFFGQRRD